MKLFGEPKKAVTDINVDTFRNKRYLEMPDDKESIEEYTEELFKSFKLNDHHNDHLVPPILEKAKMHSKANSFAPQVKKEKACHAADDRCQCCLEHTDREDIPQSCICKVEESAKEFGSGYPLYLYIVLFSMMIMAGPMMLTASWYGYKHYSGNYCASTEKIQSSLNAVDSMIKAQWKIKQTHSKSFKNFAKFLLGKTEDIIQSQNSNLALISGATAQVNVLKQLKEDELPALIPYISFHDKSYIKGLRNFMYLHCNLRMNSQNKTNCNSYKAQNCYKKFNTNCKQIAYKQIIDNLIKRSCTLAWGINNTKFTFGNNPYLSTVNSEEYDYINIFTVLSIFGIIQIFAVFYRIVSSKYDENLTSCADYSCIIDGLPKNQKNPEWEVRVEVKKLLEEHGYNVEQQVFIFCSEHFGRINNKIEKIQDELGQYLYKTKMNPELKDNKELKKQLEKFFKKKKRLNKLEDEEFSYKCTEDFMGKIIVSFSTEEQRDRFYLNYKQDGFLFNHFGCCPNQKEKLQLNFADKKKSQFQLYSTLAPEPVDILWVGQNYSSAQRTCRKYVSFWLELCFILISIVPITLVMLWADGLISSKYENVTIKEFWTFLKVKLMTISGSLTVVVLNLIVEMFLIWSTNYSKPLTVTSQQSIIASKLYKLQFINAAIVPMIVAFVTMNFFGMNGMTQNVNLIFVLNLVIPNQLAYFDAGYFIKLFEQWRLEKAIDKQDPELTTNQRDANLQYEKLDFNIAQKYTTICKTLALSMFFLPFIPLTVVLGFLTLLIDFFMTKFILYRRSNNKFKYSSEISSHMTDEFEMCLFMYACGLLTYEYVLSFISQTEYSPKPVTLVQVVFAGVNAFVIDSAIYQNWIYETFFHECKKKNHKSYTEMKQEDADDYDIMCPITRTHALKMETQQYLQKSEMAGIMLVKNLHGALGLGGKE